MIILTGPDILTPAEAATCCRVSPHTVTRWSDQGKLCAFRTPGGHRRFRRAAVEDYLNGIPARPRAERCPICGARLAADGSHAAAISGARIPAVTR